MRTPTVVRWVCAAPARPLLSPQIHYDDDWIYLGFERCRGALAAAASLDGRAPPRALQAAAKKIEAPGGRVRALREVATALGAVHAEGVSHNDLNANNVLIDRDGAFKLHDLQLAVVAPGAGGGGGAAGGSQFFSLTTFANAGLEINMARRAPEVCTASRFQSATRFCRRFHTDVPFVERRRTQPRIRVRIRRSHAAPPRPRATFCVVAGQEDGRGTSPEHCPRRAGTCGRGLGTIPKQPQSRHRGP